MNDPSANQNRHVARHFDQNHKMVKKEREKLLSTALRALAPFNVRNWRFVVVDDPEQRKQIREASWNQAQVTDASLLIILCTDLKAWSDEPLHHWRSVSAPVQELIFPSLEQYYGIDQTQHDEIMRYCGIVAQSFMLTAKSMDYDSCIISGFDCDDVAELINLPEDHAICAFVAIGKAIETPEEQPQGELPVEEVIIPGLFKQ
jgi:nitroreductase